MVVPSATLPMRVIAPVVKSKASARLVLPALWWPTRATFLIYSVVYSFMSFSLSIFCQEVGISLLETIVNMDCKAGHFESQSEASTSGGSAAKYLQLFVLPGHAYIA